MSRGNTARPRLLLTALLALSVAVALIPTAHARVHRAQRGKKAIAEIVSFDPATMLLVVKTRRGELSATVSEDVKIKIVHAPKRKRPKKDRNSEKVRATEGSIADLVPGTKVLGVQIREEVVVKIILLAPRAEDSEDPDNSEDTDDSEDSKEEPENDDAPVKDEG